MTPIIGLFVAVLAGLMTSSRRGVLAGVIPPMLAVTAAQSWYLGTGRGHNSPTTTTDSPAYWIVQLIILALICGVAASIYAIRARRTARRDSNGTAAAHRGRSAGWMVAAGTVAAFASTLALMFATDRPSHPASGNGNLPVTGVVGIVIAVLAIGAFGVLWLRDRPAHGSADAQQVVR